MKISFASQATAIKSEALILCMGGEQSVGTLCAFAGIKDSAPIVDAASKRGFTNEFEKVLSLITAGEESATPNIIILIGMGDSKSLDTMHAGRVGTVIFEQLSKLRVKNAVVAIKASDLIGRTAGQNYVQSMACRLGDADFTMADKFKSVSPDAPTPPFKVEEVTLLADDFNDDNGNMAQYIDMVAKAVKFTKELGATPSNYMTPDIMANTVRDALTPLGVRVEILNEEKLTKLNMNGLLSVGKGSTMESKLAVMRWGGGAPDGKEIVLVGKGVTFDSGGISIKPSKNMEEMKFDMSGAGAVAGAIHLLAARKAAVNVVGIIGLVENMPSGSALKPGDVVKTMSGKSIEVLNTDAEGRVILSDLLWYAQTMCNPMHVIDLATLTGAITVALGHGIYAGLYANNDELATKLAHAGDASGEWLWRMPLNVEYDKMISSEIADVKNISSGSGGGSITAAHFLMRFIKNETSWAHIDIAGMAYRSNWLPAAHCAATGFGVYLLDTFIKSFE